jgi:hypothetical protein
VTRVLACCAVLTAVTALAALGQGPERPISPGLSLGSSAATVSEVSGSTSDVGHYLQAGTELSELREIHGGYRRFWTLGMPMVVALVLLLGGASHFPLAMVLAAILAWGLALGIGASHLSPRGRPVVGLLCASTLWLSPDLRDWVFGAGAILSDGMGAAWFLAGVASMLAALKEPKLQRFVAAGLLLGVAANFRYQTLMLTRPVLLAMLLAVLGLLWLRGYRAGGLWRVVRRGPGVARDADAAWLEAALRGMVAAVAALALTLIPWTAYKLALDGTANWYNGSDRLKYGRMWTPDEQQASWAHAANAQCHADPELCRDLNAAWDESTFPKLKRLALLTTLEHPIDVASYKLEGFSWLWWDRSWAGLADDWTSLIEGAALLSAGLVGLLLFCWGAWRRRSPAGWVVLVGLAMTLGHQVAMFTFLHFEWRYSLPLRTLCAMAPWWALGFFYRSR